MGTQKIKRNKERIRKKDVSGGKKEKLINKCISRDFW